MGHGVRLPSSLRFGWPQGDAASVLTDRQSATVRDSARISRDGLAGKIGLIYSGG
jgi:hypothetical protein